MKILELFAGYGSQALALERLGIDFTSEISEIDKYAIQAYNQLHGETFNHGDITKIEKLGYYDLWTYSFPCLVGNTLIATETRGLIPIKNVIVGEKVLTHDGSYKEVLANLNQGIKKTNKVKTMLSNDVQCTPNHKFYVRKKYRKWYNSERTYRRLFTQPEWVEAKNLNRSYYVGFPINTKSQIPNWDGIDYVWSDGRATRHKNDISLKLNDKNFWYIMGRYIADGWLRKDSGIIICCAKSEFEEMKQMADNFGFNYQVSEERTVYKFSFVYKELAKFCSQFGKYAHSKFIPQFIIDLPENLLESFLEGYMSGDGCYTNDKYKATSVSKELVYGLSQCVMKVYKRPVSVYYTKRKPKCIIEGREVNQRDSWGFVYTKEKRKQDKAFYENGYIWAPFNKIIEANDEEVYDLVIDENHSFVANNVIVHNCTDLSYAGKREGFIKDDGSLTRSGLLYHVERLLKDCVKNNESPKYLLLENVKALVGKKFKPDFDKWLETLETLGYNNYWKVLNAKDYGIPQNRERVFVVSVRKDVDTDGYQFPDPIILEKRLKDILEDNVDESFYVNNEKTDAFIKDYIEKLNQKAFSDDTPIKHIGNINRKESHGGYAGDVFDPEGLSPTLNTMGGGNRMPFIKEGSIIDDTQSFDGTRIYEDYAPSLRASRSGLKTVSQIGNLYPDAKFTNPHRGRIYDKEGISPTIDCMTGGGREPKIMEPVCVASRGRNPDNPSDRSTGAYLEQRYEVNESGCTNTLTTVSKDNYVFSDFRIRKLTPKECWRLMGVKDEEYAKLTGISKTQQYKMAGNSIVVDVLVEIFRNMFGDKNG